MECVPYAELCYPCGFEVLGVVAGAQRLDDLELGCGVIEFRPVFELTGTDVVVVFGVFQQVEKLRPAVRSGRQLSSRGEQLMGDGEGFLRVRARGQDARHAASPLVGDCREWQRRHRSDALRSSSN
jgi:hypothetical protein